MKKIIVLFLILIMSVFSFAACDKNMSKEDVIGVWKVESVSKESGELLAVGEMWGENYDKKIPKISGTIEFKKDGTFELNGFEENEKGKYKIEGAQSDIDVRAIYLTFHDESEELAGFGIRTEHSGEKAETLIFGRKGKIYSFLKNKIN